MEHKNLIGLAIGGTTLKPHSLSEIISMYRQAGLESFFSGNGDKKMMDEIANASAKEGMVWTSIHAPFVHVSRLWREDKEKSEMELADQMKAVDDAAEYNVPIVVIHPFIGFKDHTPTDIGVENYKRLLDYAGEKGVLLALENVEGEEYLDYLMAHLKGHPALRFCCDTGHEMCYNHGRDTIKDYGDILAYLHIDSNLGSHALPGDDHTWYDDSHLLPYDGIADMNRLIHNLKRVNYTGPLTLELTRFSKPERTANDIYKDLSEEAYLTLCYERISRLRNELEALG